MLIHNYNEDRFGQDLVAQGKKTFPTPKSITQSAFRDPKVVEQEFKDEKLLKIRLLKEISEFKVEYEQDKKNGRIEANEKEREKIQAVKNLIRFLLLLLMVPEIRYQFQPSKIFFF